MSTKPTAGRVRATNEFIKAHRDEHSVCSDPRFAETPSTGTIQVPRGGEMENVPRRARRRRFPSSAHSAA
jgi:hypothetical protein